MFAKLQKFHLDRGAVQRNAATATPCNDNAPVRRAAVLPRQARRPVLACRWYRTPAGRLECGWHMAQPGASPEEPGISRRIGRRASAITASAAGALLLLL
jgi:hypothetical protein